MGKPSSDVISRDVISGDVISNKAFPVFPVIHTQKKPLNRGASILKLKYSYFLKPNNFGIIGFPWNLRTTHINNTRIKKNGPVNPSTATHLVP